MASKEERRPGDIRVYLVSCLLLLCIIAGGAFLGMYIALPNSKPWYPVAGLGLVGIPWVFWVFTFMYSFLRRGLGNDDNININNKNHVAKGGKVASNPSTPTKSGEDSDGGHVRFGGTTVMGNQEGHEDGSEADMESPKTPHQNGEGGQMRLERTASSSTSNNEQGSYSHKSHESELPLVSMSS